MGTEQQFCLKWNNHRTTLFSVFDSLLEEESLVDVTLSAEGQFLRAHRIVLSACSPYFRNLFRSSFLTDKHPVIFMKDVDFENLKSMVEYMYKGEANVLQHMLPSFIQTAEQLQIRGLAERATKQLDSEGITDPHPPSASATPPSSSTPSSTSQILPQPPLRLPLPQHQSSPLAPTQVTPSKKRSSQSSATSAAATAAAAQVAAATTAAAQAAAAVQAAGGPGGILAARLANSTTPLFDFTQEMLLGRQPPPLGLPGLACLPAPPAPSQTIPPPMKKSRKSNDPKPLSIPPFIPTSMPPVGALAGLPGSLKVSPATPNKREKKDKSVVNAQNNNYESDDGALKIDEEVDPGKENKDIIVPSPSHASSGKVVDDDDIVDLEASNGVSGDDDEEEPSMPGPGGELNESGSGTVLNPWTGEPINISEDQDESGNGDGGNFSMLEASSRSLDSTGGGNTMNNSNGNTDGDPKDPSLTKYACNRCGRSYLHQATLVRHQRYECGISASYPCALCGRKFKRRDVLKGHMEKCASKSTQAAQAAAQAAAVAAVTGGSAAVTAPVSLSTSSNPLPGLTVSSPFVPPSTAI